MEQQGASRVGLHFIADHQKCQRLFYIKYILGIAPKEQPEAAFKGVLLHAAVAAITQKTDPDFVLKAADTDDLPHLVEWTELFKAQYEADLLLYDLFASEQTYEVKLENGYVFSFRPDRIMRRKSDGALVIFETKTTGWSTQAMASQVRLDQQATAYIMGAQKAFPGENVVGVIPEIFYAKGRVVDLSRQPTIVKSFGTLRKFELALISELEEIAQKTNPRNLEAHHPFYLFRPRFLEGCIQFGRPCAYADICQTDIKGCPPGFVESEPWIGSEDYKHLLETFKGGAA